VRKLRKIELHFIFAVVAMALIILTGAIFYHYYENLNWLNAFYFTTTTVLTIGYGDFAPSSDLSKTVTIVYSLISVPTMVFCFGILVEDFLDERIEKMEDKVNQVLADEEKILKNRK